MVAVVINAVEPLPSFSTKAGRPSHRKSYTIKEKREFVNAVDALIAKDIPRRKACVILGLHPNYYSRFKKVVAKVDALEKSDGFVAHRTNGTARRIHPGRPSLLSVIKDDLSRFIFEKRQNGIQVSTRMIRQEACRLLPSFRMKSVDAMKKAVLRYTKQLGLTHRAATHTAQKHFTETQEESNHFIH